MDNTSSSPIHPIYNILDHHKAPIDITTTTLSSQVSNLAPQQNNTADIKSTLRQLFQTLAEISSKLSSYQPSPPSESAVAAPLQTRSESLIQPPPPTHFASPLSKTQNPTNFNYDQVVNNLIDTPYPLLPLLSLRIPPSPPKMLPPTTSTLSPTTASTSPAPLFSRKLSSPTTLKISTPSSQLLTKPSSQLLHPSFCLILTPPAPQPSLSSIFPNPKTTPTSMASIPTPTSNPPNKRVQPAAALLFPYSPTLATSISHPFPQLFTPVTNPLCLSKPSFDTELETLSLNHYRTVVSIVRPDGRSNSNGMIFIDDVQITHQDLFIDGKIIIPDALSIIYPPSPFSCTTARPLSQIHSFLSTSLNDKVVNWYASLLDPIVVIFLPMDIVLDKEMKRLAGVKQKELLIGIWACLVKNKIYHQMSITFDPGGALDMADIKKGDAVMLVLGLTTYDLEDKVYFEGKAMIRPAPYTLAQPKHCTKDLD